MATEETELKLRLDAAAVDRWRDRLQAHGAHDVRLRARYFDTADSRLARGRVALRLRQEGTHWVQTLKGPGENAVRRLEHEVALPARQRAPARPDLSLHAGSEAGAALSQALGGAGAEALSERFETDVRRASRLFFTAAGTEVELALDQGEVRAGKARDVVTELELELKGGAPEGLFDMARDAVSEGGLWLSTLTKAQRGERLLFGAAAPAVKAQPMTKLARPAGGPEFLSTVLHNVLDQVLHNATEVAEGSTDAERIHQLRIGLRRLRTALRELQALDDAIRAEWERPLAEAFARLGERRDNEAVAAAVRPLLEAAGAPKTTWPAPEFADTRAAVRSVEFQAVLVEVMALAHRGAGAGAALSRGALKALLAGRLDRLHRQVLRDGRRFEVLAVERQHRVRKRLKRLRYLAEFVRPLWPGKPVDRFLKRLKPAQDALGAHNDTVVAADRFRAEARHDPAALFSAGYLQAHLQATGVNARKALREVEKAKPFWKKG